MNIFLKITLFIFLPLTINAQQENPYLDNLYKSLSVAANDTARMEVCSKLALYYSLEDRDSSGFYIEKALSIAVRLNLKFDEASILNGMGVILMQQEKFAKSLEYYLKALNIAKDPSIEKTIRQLSPGQNRKSARMLLLSECYDLIGLLNAYTGNWMVNTKNQLKNYREAEKYAKAAGDKGQIAYVNFHMGIAYMNEGMLDSAVMLMKTALVTFAELKDQPGSGRALKFLGDTYQKMGDFELAANTLRQSIASLKETNDQLHLGLGYMSLSRIYTDLNKKDSALYCARESLSIFEKRKDAAWKRDAYNLLTSCFDQLGQTDSAIAYLKLSKSLNDSLSIAERINLLAFLDVVTDEQVKLEKLEKEKIQTRSKIRTYGMIGGLVILSLIGVILYRNNRKEKKAKIFLENTLQELKSAQAQLIQSEKMASLGELTAGIAHEIQNPLNFVNNFSDVNKELLSELKDEADKGNMEEVKAIASNVIDNSEKIFLHGKRADAIVRGMLQHSRTSSGQKEPTDINALCEEYMRLSYHGFRAKDKSFNAMLRTEFDESIRSVNVIPQDIGRVIMNLMTNAFYACAESSRTWKAEAVGVKNDIAKQNEPAGYDPVVSISTKKINKAVEIRIADNGSGIPQNVIDKIFQPFYTTKPPGQGTGLGLSLAYDIVKAHGGEIRVNSSRNEGTAFIISLPVMS